MSIRYPASTRDHAKLFGLSPRGRGRKNRSIFNGSTNNRSQLLINSTISEDLSTEGKARKNRLRCLASRYPPLKTALAHDDTSEDRPFRTVDPATFMFPSVEDSIDSHGNENPDPFQHRRTWRPIDVVPIRPVQEHVATPKNAAKSASSTDLASESGNGNKTNNGVIKDHAQRRTPRYTQLDMNQSRRVGATNWRSRRSNVGYSREGAAKLHEDGKKDGVVGRRVVSAGVEHGQ